MRQSSRLAPLDQAPRPTVEPEEAAAETTESEKEEGPDGDAMSKQPYLREQASSDDYSGFDSDSDDEDVMRVNYANYNGVYEELFRSVVKGVQKHVMYKEARMVRMEYLLETLHRYELEGYKPNSGTVVEILDASMEWNLAIVSNIYASPNEYAVNFEDLLDSVDVVKKPTEGEMESTEHEQAKPRATPYTLKMGREETYCCTAITQDSDRTGRLSHGNDPDEVRPPEAAVWAVWGFSPRYWMQYQLICAEQQMRFDRFHAFDFEEINWNKWIEDRFDQYLDSRRNEAFKEYYNERTMGERNALKKIIFEPFDMMNSITNKWFEDFDESISCYRYLSFLGKDWLGVLLCLSIQIIIPATLFWSSWENHHKNIQEKCEDEDEDYVEGSMPLFSGCESHTIMRPRQGQRSSRIAFIGIVLYYLVKVLPDEMHNFYMVASESEGTLSKLMSLRRSVYLQDEDSLLQKVGYRLGIFMNTTYNSALYLFNLIVLFTYDDPWDIILNALAVEFIKDIDESFTSSTVYDTDFRYLKAGAVEMVMNRFLDKHDLDEVLHVDAIPTRRGSVFVGAQEGSSTDNKKASLNQIKGDIENVDGKSLSDKLKLNIPGVVKMKSVAQKMQQDNRMESVKDSNGSKWWWLIAGVKRREENLRSHTKEIFQHSIESIKKSKSELHLVDGGSHEDIAEMAHKFVQQPKKHFYNLYSTLKAAEKAGDADKTKRGLLFWMANVLKHTPFLPLYKEEKAIFDQFGEYRPSDKDLKLKKAWDAVCYAEVLPDQKTEYRPLDKDLKHKKAWDAVSSAEVLPDQKKIKLRKKRSIYKQRPDLKWLSIDRMRERFDILRSITKDKKDEDEIIINAVDMKAPSNPGDTIFAPDGTEVAVVSSTDAAPGDDVFKPGDALRLSHENGEWKVKQIVSDFDYSIKEDDALLGDTATSWELVIKNAENTVNKVMEAEKQTGADKKKLEASIIDFKRELAVMENFRKWTAYEPREVPAFFEDIWGIIAFEDIQKPLRRALKKGNVLRFLIVFSFAVVNWVSTLLEILFVPIMIMWSVSGIVYM